MMTPAQKRAVYKHRLRQLRKGIMRMEINVPAKDRDMLRTTAEQLRAEGSMADQIRKVLGATLKGSELIDFKQFLELAPLEGVDLERDKDVGRDIEF